MSRNKTFATGIDARLTSRDVFGGGWMLGTVVATDHTFLFDQSSTLSYAYAFTELAPFTLGTLRR